MGCQYVYTQLQELNKAMAAIRRAGIPEDSPALLEIRRLRNKALAFQTGVLPRGMTQLLRLAGLSPGILALWLDSEAGFMVEARERPGAPPVYHLVDEAIAEDILAGRSLHDYAARFVEPAEDVDN